MSEWSEQLRRLAKPENASLAGIGAAGLVAGWIAAYAMRWGPSAYSDSVSYLEMAHNLLAGLGPVEIKGSGNIELLAAHPPFYSIALAFTSLNGAPLIDSARILNIILLALFVSGVGVALAILTRRPILALFTSLFLLSSRVIITHFTGVMSEPVFFCIGFLGLLLVLIYIRSRQPIWLWASAILAGLTFITRFSGAALIGAGCVAIVMFPPNPIKKRLLDALLYFGMGMVPFILYRVYLKRIGAYLGVYGVPALPEMAKLVNGFFTTLASEGVGWLPWGTLIGPRFPHQKGLILIALGLIAVSILAAVLIRRGKAAFRAAWDRPNFQLGVTFLVFNLGYVALLIGTYLFVSFPKPYIDGRLLSPLLVGGLLCAAGFLDYILEEIRPVSLRQIIPAALLMIFIVANLSITASYVQAMHIAGDGYTAKKWQRSGTVKALVKLPASVHIISDNIDVVKLYTFRAASRIPELESQTPRPLDQAFGGDPSDPVEAQFRGGQAALVLFNDAYTQFSAMYGERAAQVRWKALTAGLYAYYQGADGAIYFYSAPK